MARLTSWLQTISEPFIPHSVPLVLWYLLYYKAYHQYCCLYNKGSYRQGSILEISLSGEATMVQRTPTCRPDHRQVKNTEDRRKAWGLNQEKLREDRLCGEDGRLYPKRLESPRWNPTRRWQRQSYFFWRRWRAVGRLTMEAVSPLFWILISLYLWFSGSLSVLDCWHLRAGLNLSPFLHCKL